MSSPTTGGSERAPTGLSLSSESQRGVDTSIEVASNQTPLDRVDDDDIVEVQSQEGTVDPNSKENVKFRSVAWNHFKRVKVIDTFDQAAARNSLEKMIILHEYPLSIVEHHGFKEFCNTIQPLFKVVSRNTVRADILKIYEHEKSKTMELLDRNRSRFAITTNMWTSSNEKRRFMAITTHFIDDSWTLQSRIVRFIYVPCPHTPDVLSNALVECLLDWNMDRKLSTLTVDNCTTNDAMIDILLDKLQFNSLLLGGKVFHIGCLAHIVNLIGREALGVISEALEKVRDSVAYWTATPKRWETFEQVSNQLNIPRTKKLSLDCKTRWNSTYLMLQSALPYKEVFSRLKQRDSQYKCLPLEDDWLLAIEICDRLEFFYEVMELFSGTKYPTVNLFFLKICEIKISMQEWASSRNNEVRMMAMNMTSEFEKYWSSVQGVMALGMILDPRFKMRGVEFLFPKIYNDGATEEIEKVRNLAFDVFKEYQASEKNSENRLKNDFSNASSSQSQRSLGKDRFFNEFNLFISSTSSHDVAKSELDYYLAEPVFPRVENFDILAWWKSNVPKYPTLHAMAKDILAIPVSTVAPESAFSTSGRFLCPHRSKLHPKTLEALMCTQDWLWTEIQGDSSTSAPFERQTINDDNDIEEGIDIAGVVNLL